MNEISKPAAPPIAFAGAIDALPDHIAILDRHGVITNANGAWRIYAQENGSPDALAAVGSNYLAVCDAAAAMGEPHAREVAEGLRAVLDGRTSVFTHEYPCHSPDEERWFALRASSFTDGDQPRVMVAHTSISERVRAERDLHLSLERYRLAALATSDVIFDWDVGRDAMYWAPGVEGIFGHPDVPERGHIDWWIDHIHPEDRARVVAARFETLAELRGMRDIAYRYRRGDGSYAFVHDRFTVLRAANDQALRMIGSICDVSGQREGAAQLDLHSRLLESVDDAIVAADASGAILYWNAPAERLLGRRAVETLGQPLASMLTIDAPDDRAAVQKAVEWGQSWRGETVLAVNGAGKRDVIVTVSPLAHSEGYGGTVYTMVDLSEHRAAAEEREKLFHSLAEQRHRLDSIVHNAPFGVLLAEVPSGRLLLNNRRLEEIYGRAYDGLDEVADGESTGLSRLDGSEILEHQRPFVRAIRRGERVDGEVYRYERSDGSVCWVRVDAVPLQDDDSGVRSALITVQDVTAQVETERALQHSEGQLRQSQKMEAVGRLAGGVAHDFNNLLGVMMSYSAMLLEELQAGDPIRADISEIQTAVERAAELTRQLLAFSRQQVMQPAVIDLHDVVRASERMLRRLIGEDITLNAQHGDEACTVLADPGQLEQVVLNLALNARDAMPTGGTLQIGVRRVRVGKPRKTDPAAPVLQAGDWALLSVSDTGVGMDAATKALIFDPFFTTKEVGKGTGLGLATVYGIVRQSGGEVFVRTEQGVGTEFSIYLPSVVLSLGGTGEHRILADPAVEPAAGTILLVEDEAALRRITARLLEREGYRVIAAANGAEALAHVAALAYGQRIDCVVTDVVMPDVSGQQLVERIDARLGRVAAVFLSGYSIEAVERHGVLRDGTQLLTKPVPPRALLDAVRSAIATTPLRS